MKKKKKKKQKHITLLEIVKSFVQNMQFKNCTDNNNIKFPKQI